MFSSLIGKWLAVVAGKMKGVHACYRQSAHSFLIAATTLPASLPSAKPKTLWDISSII
jgi:hypothetical protein